MLLRGATGMSKKKSNQYFTEKEKIESKGLFLSELFYKNQSGRINFLQWKLSAVVYTQGVCFIENSLRYWLRANKNSQFLISGLLERKILPGETIIGCRQIIFIFNCNRSRSIQNNFGIVQSDTYHSNQKWNYQEVIFQSSFQCS